MRPITIQIPQFEGPLDLLLTIVRTNGLSISKLPLAPIAAQYLEYMKEAERIDVNLGMDWLEMAARLIHWKSSSLLPIDPALPDPSANLAAELGRELKTLSDAQLHQAKEFLSGRGEEQERLWTKISGENFEESPKEEKQFASLWTIRKKAQALRDVFLRGRSVSEPVFDASDESVDTGTMLEWARLKIAESEIGVPIPAASWFAVVGSLGHKICLFLALLELAKALELKLDEHPDDGGVWITPLRGAGMCAPGPFITA